MTVPTEIIAHRGYSAAAPENTRAAMVRAIDAGAHGVEWDVRFAACGTPVVFHDARLERTSDGSGEVAKRRWSDLSGLDAGSWFGPDFRGEGIPTFADLLHLLRRWGGRGYPEIKAANRAGDLATLVTLSRQAGLLPRLSFISMELAYLEEIRRLDREVELAPVVDSRRTMASALTAAAELAPAFLDVDFRILLEQPRWVEEALAMGVAVGVWTVDHPDDATRLRDLGVTRFTTNRVSTLLEWARTG